MISSFVSAIVGGLFVLIGVLVAEWLARVGSDRRSIAGDVQLLGRSHPVLLMYYSDVPDSPQVPRSPESDQSHEYWQIRRETLLALFNLRVQPRWPMRRARRIRENATHLLRLTMAAEFRYQNGTPLKTADVVFITSESCLAGLLSRRSSPIDNDAFDRYVTDGFPRPLVESDPCLRTRWWRRIPRSKR